MEAKATRKKKIHKEQSQTNYKEECKKTKEKRKNAHDHLPLRI